MVFQQLNRHCIVLSWVIMLLLSFSDGAPWQSPCTPVQHRRIDGLLEQDRLLSADSAFSALETDCFLTPSDLIKWMRVKAVLSQYSEAARIACMVVREQADVAFLVQDQLTDMIQGAGADTIRIVMRRYGDCMLSSPDRDTMAVRQFLAGIYSRFKLYDEETDILLRLDSKRYPSANDLYVAAQRRFSQKSFPAAIRLALHAYSRLHDETQRSSCAMMLYQSFAQTGKNDSASLWLQKVPLTRPDVKALAVVFFQRMGLIAKADSLAATLPQSFSRDTLALRRMLYSADFEGAVTYARRLSASYPSRRERNELLLWRIRALLFRGKADQAGVLMDSVEFAPAMNGVEEFLNYKYEITIIKNYSGAWGIFGSVAYAAWLMRPDKALGALASPDCDACVPEIRRLIFLAGIRTLMEGGLFADARRIMERMGNSSADNEFRYYYGEVLYNEGAVGPSRKVFEEMLLTHPGDVFSERARIFLLRINGKNKGGRHGDTLDEKRHH